MAEKPKQPIRADENPTDASLDTRPEREATRPDDDDDDADMPLDYGVSPRYKGLAPKSGTGWLRRG